MGEGHTTTLNAEQGPRFRGTASFILTGLSGGHAVFHWFNQSFLVMLPDVEATFGLGRVQIGAITATREFASGAVMLPSGVVMDVLRPYWGLVLAICMAGFGLGWLLIGLAPGYAVLLLGMVVVAVSSSIWHLPAMGALSHHFSHRRGTALSLHGVGGNIGDFVGPLVTGALLLVLTWQAAIEIYAVIPLVLTFVVFWAFRDIGAHKETSTSSRTLRQQLHLTKYVFRNVTLWVVMFVAGLRGMAYLAFITFLPLYMADDLDFSSLKVGFHMGMLVLVGIVATPTLGYISDRLGRKTVILPSLTGMASISLLLVPFGDGIMFTVLLGLLGLFLYSDQPILTAAALDMVDEDMHGTTLGVLSFERILMGGLSPIFAGLLYDGIGIDAVFYYTAGLFALAATILLGVRFKMASHPGPRPQVASHPAHP